MRAVRSLVFIFLAVLPMLALAQEDEYFTPEVKRANPIKKEDLKKAVDNSPTRRYGPKFSFEAHAYLTYAYFMPSPALRGFFTNTSSGASFDGGVGIKLRVRRRFGVGIGLRYSIRQFSMEYPVTGETQTGQLIPLDVAEDVVMYMPGIYLRPQWELGRRIYMGPFMQLNFIGVNVISRTVMSQQYGPVQISESPIISSYSIQFDVGIHAGFKLHIAEHFIIKPGVELGLGMAPAFHTGLYQPNSSAEENARFINIRIGAVFEFGVWFDKVKPDWAR